MHPVLDILYFGRIISESIKIIVSDLDFLSSGHGHGLQFKEHVVNPNSGLFKFRWWLEQVKVCQTIYEITSQELQMLSSLTINCQVTMIVMNSGSQLSDFCNQCLKCHKSP